MCAVHVYSVSLCSRQESDIAKAASMPDAEDQSMMGRFVRVERQVRSPGSSTDIHISQIMGDDLLVRQRFVAFYG